jgi:hypothetical protein
MKGNMPYFKLFKDNKLQYWCHTKDYKVQQLLPGQNYMDFFNIPQAEADSPSIGHCSVSMEYGGVEKDLRQSSSSLRITDA